MDAAQAGITSDPPMVSSHPVTPLGHDIDVWFAERVRSIPEIDQNPTLSNALHAAKDDLKASLVDRYERKAVGNVA